MCANRVHVDEIFPESDRAGFDPLGEMIKNPIFLSKDPILSWNDFLVLYCTIEGSEFF